MQNNIFKRTESGKVASARVNDAQDKALQDELMQELAQRKTFLENLTSKDADENNSPLNNRTSAGSASPGTLRDHVEQTLHNYFSQLDGQPVTNIYEMVLAEVEAPLLEVVMRNAMGNQCRAAQLLGMSRGTLRKKLQQYNLL